MRYKVKFSTHSIEKRFDKALSKISRISTQDEIMEAVEGLADNPRPYGKKTFKQLSPPVRFYRFVAQYRIRIGDYRVLYTITPQHLRYPRELWQTQESGIRSQESGERCDPDP